MAGKSVKTMIGAAEGLSANVARVLSGRMVFLDMSEQSPGMKKQVLALKPDQILVTDDGEIRPYRGEPFKELDLKIGRRITLLYRMDNDNKEYLIVAKRRKHNRETLVKLVSQLAPNVEFKAIASVFVVAVAALALFSFMKGDVHSALLGVLTSVAQFIRSLF